MYFCSFSYTYKYCGNSTASHLGSFQETLPDAVEYIISEYVSGYIGYLLYNVPLLVNYPETQRLLNSILEHGITSDLSKAIIYLSDVERENIYTTMTYEHLKLHDPLNFDVLSDIVNNSDRRDLALSENKVDDSVCLEIYQYEPNHSDRENIYELIDLPN